MIRGKAKLEFGTGDIRITAAQSNGIVAVCLITQEPHEIGEKIPVEDGWNVTEAEVILTFSRPESIDSLIRELECARLMMTGDWPENDLIVRDEVFDFDAFMEI